MEKSVHIIDYTHEYAVPSNVRRRHTARRRRRRAGMVLLGALNVLAAVALALYLVAQVSAGVHPPEPEPPPIQVVNERVPAQDTAPSAPPAELPAGARLPAQGQAEPLLDPAQPLPATVSLAVASVFQLPELPNGCEAATLAALLGHYGFGADKLELAYGYIPRQDFGGENGMRLGPDPATAYAGDPAGNGFYCLPPALCEGANHYLAAQGSALRARDITGLAPQDIDAYLAAGHPVALWVTLSYSPTAHYAGHGWTLPDGTQYTPYSNLHCVAVYGYTDDCYLIWDPREGDIAVGREAVWASCLALGANAMVIA